MTRKVVEISEDKAEETLRMRESFDGILELSETNVEFFHELLFLLGLTIEETLFSLTDIAKR